MFPVLVRELEQAQHYIYIEYFIINDGVYVAYDSGYTGTARHQKELMSV